MDKPRVGVIMGSDSDWSVMEDAVTALAEDLQSHFTYEETELAEPLGLLGML